MSTCVGNVNWTNKKLPGNRADGTNLKIGDYVRIYAPVNYVWVGNEWVGNVEPDQNILDFLNMINCSPESMWERKLKQVLEEKEKVQQERDMYRTWYKAKHDDVEDNLNNLHSMLDLLTERCTEKQHKIEFLMEQLEILHEKLEEVKDLTYKNIDADGCGSICRAIMEIVLSGNE